MTNIFPTIKTIHDVLPAIEGYEEFIVAERPSFNVINYLVNYETTFLDPNELGISDQERKYRQIRRECRGIVFNKHGDIIRRPMNKFFNVNERLETNISNVDISRHHVILDKIDGSFIAPFVAECRLIYGTKMGETSVSELVYKFIADKPQYNEFCNYLINNNRTPIFEYIGPDNRIVISYSKSDLILLAIRNMYTGEYYKYDNMKKLAEKYNIPVINSRTGSITGMKEFVDEARNLQTNEEGFVIRFDNGEMFKVKSDLYVAKHRIKDSISQEKNLLELIFSEKIDDAYATLDLADAEKVKLYADSVLKHATSVATFVKETVEKYKPLLNNEKKRFALEVVPNHRSLASVLFSAWDGKDPFAEIKKLILSNCGSQTKVNSIRALLGELTWAEIYTAPVDLNG